MVFSPHILAGAAIGAKAHNLGLVIILGLATHVFLDKLPHWDYMNPGIRKFSKAKDFRALFYDLFKISIDGLIGFSLVFLTVWLSPRIFKIEDLIFILIGIFFSVLPDIILFSLILLGGSFSEKYRNFHSKFLHNYTENEKEGKITFLGLATQVLLIIISIVIIFS